MIRENFKTKRESLYDIYLKGDARTKCAKSINYTLKVYNLRRCPDDANKSVTLLFAKIFHEKKFS